MGAATGVPRTFGVEEEYLLLDMTTGLPVDRAAELVYATADLTENAEREYFSSQLETATPVCYTADEAEEALTSFRKSVARAAMPREVIVAGTGLPPVGGDVAGTITPKPRYQAIGARMRAVAETQYVTGTHVHVEVPSRDVGVEVIERIARWMPALLAMTANSPLWCGEPTRFASWRHIMCLPWPVSGYPLGFANGDEYSSTIHNLIDSGVIPDPGLVTWVIRLSDNYPTVELRIADAQLDANSAVSYATIVRALVEHAVRDVEAGNPRPHHTRAMVDGAIWMAARNGLGGELVDPLTSESMPAFDFVDRMLATISDELEEFGDSARVDRYVQRLRDLGDPAKRQLAVFSAHGVDGLLKLYRASSLASPQPV